MYLLQAMDIRAAATLSMTTFLIAVSKLLTIGFPAALIG